MVILSLSVFIVLGIQIWEAYVDKTRWYQMKVRFSQLYLILRKRPSTVINSSRKFEFSIVKSPSFLSSSFFSLFFFFYITQDTVPPGLWKYFSSSVKKSSGIIKRLIRVSEIWIYEYKDFDGFLRRANILVGDYLKRFLFKSSGSSN